MTLQILITMKEINFKLQLKLLALVDLPENDCQEPEIRSFCIILSIDIFMTSRERPFVLKEMKKRLWINLCHEKNNEGKRANGKKFIWRFWNSKNKWIRQSSHFYGWRRSSADWIIKENSSKYCRTKFLNSKSWVYGQSSTVNKYDRTPPAICNDFINPNRQQLN
jgi:hypothetical protein